MTMGRVDRHRRLTPDSFVCLKTPPRDDEFQYKRWDEESTATASPFGIRKYKFTLDTTLSRLLVPLLSSIRYAITPEGRGPGSQHTFEV